MAVYIQCVCVCGGGGCIVCMGLHAAACLIGQLHPVPGHNAKVDTLAAEGEGELQSM